MKHNIHFLPDDVHVTVEDGENLLSAAAAAGVYIHAYCGGDGVCGKCKVTLENGDVESDSAASLKKGEYDKGVRLACKARVVSDITVRIPEMVKADGKALKCAPKTTRAISARSLDSLIGSWSVDPPVGKKFLKIPPPTLEDNISDMQRLMRALKNANPDSLEPSYDHPELIHELPLVLRGQLGCHRYTSAWQGTKRARQDYCR